MAIVKGSTAARNDDEFTAAFHLAFRRRLCLAAARPVAYALGESPQNEALVRLRFMGACSAGQVGCGQAKDAKHLDDKARASWRTQSLNWLRTELEVWSTALEGDPGRKEMTANAFRLWIGLKELAVVRDPEALATLPEEEAKAWQALWRDMQALLERCR